MIASRNAIQVVALWACLYAPVGAACAGLIDDDADDADHLALAALPQYDAVGFTTRQNLQNQTVLDSSGILLTPDWVLTAAHTIVSGGSPDTTFTIGGETRNIAQAIRNPSFDGQIANGYDVALLKLDAPITNVTPANLYTGTAASLQNQTLTYVGYGRSGTGSTGDTIPSGTKRAGNNIGDQLGFTLNPGPGQVNYSNQIMFADMDKQGGGGGGNPLGGGNPINLEYLIALGDSGGGLFVEQNGQHFVAGVHSIIFNFSPSTLGYGDVMGSTTLEQSLTWILDTIAPDPIAGDLDGDGFVGINDLNIVLGLWNMNVTPGDLGLGDPSGDGFVGIADLNIVLGNWNAGTPPTAGVITGLVPEPGSIALLVVTSGVLLNQRKSNRPH